MARCLFPLILALLAFGWSGAARADGVLKPRPCIVVGAWGQGMAPSADSLDCRTRQKDHGSGDFQVWIGGFSALSTPEDPLFLRTGSVWQDAVTLAIYYADGHRETARSTSATTSPMLRPGALIQYDLPPHSAPVTGILAHVEGSANLRGVLIAPQILSRSEAHRRDLSLVALYAGVAGMFVALLCYNFALWTVMRRRFQLAYCAMLVAMIGYLFSSSGGLAWAYPAIDNNDRLRLNYALLTLVGASAILFGRYYFEARVFPRWFSAATFWVVGALLAATGAFVLFAPAQIRLLDTINSVAYAGLLLWVIPITYYAIVGKSRFVLLFLAAWLLPIVFALVRVLSNLGVLGQFFWIDNSTLLTLGAEALVSAIAIAYRVRVLSDERDRARADESMALLLSETDPLTGLPNRRAFQARALAAGGAHRLMLIDIDDLKSINDRLGRAAGDEILCNVAGILREFAPSGSTIARLSGVEFAVLIPAALADPVSPAEIVSAIRTARMPGGQKLSVSIGIAEGAWESEEEWQALHGRADRALYRARRDGGGRFGIDLSGGD